MLHNIHFNLIEGRPIKGKTLIWWTRHAVCIFFNFHPSILLQVICVNFTKSLSKQSWLLSEDFHSITSVFRFYLCYSCCEMILLSASVKSALVVFFMVEWNRKWKKGFCLCAHKGLFACLFTTIIRAHWQQPAIGLIWDR